VSVDWKSVLPKYLRDYADWLERPDVGLRLTGDGVRSQDVGDAFDKWADFSLDGELRVSFPFYRADLSADSR